MGYIRPHSRRPIPPSLPHKRYVVPFLVLVALGPGRLEGQTLQIPVTELRILGTDGSHDWGAVGQGGAPAREVRGTTTASTRLTLPGGSAALVAPYGASSPEPRQQAAGPAGSTRIRLSLAEPIPAPPRRLKPPPARPEIATTWVPAGQVRLDAASAASPVEGGSVRLTFHAAEPDAPSASAGRFPEDARPATMNRSARPRSQPDTCPGATRWETAHPGAARPGTARPGAAEPGPGWPLNPLRAGGSWRGR